VSAPELALATVPADILEVGTWQGRDPAPVLPPLGRVSAAASGLVLAVRPQRWLMVLEPAAPLTNAARWQELMGTSGAVVELSTGLAAYFLAGASAREVLKRGCRLDLAAEVFPAGGAAATHMAQVAVTLAALPGGLLLVTPASTARHLREWLGNVGRPFGLVAVSDVSVARLAGEQRA
jgi:sarcosine oxidase, subunit gamma